MSFSQPVLFLREEGGPDENSGGTALIPMDYDGTDETEDQPENSDTQDPPKKETEPPVEPAKKEGKPPLEPPKAQEPPKTETPPSPPVFNWKAEIAKLPKRDVLKALGHDDFIVEMLEYKEKTGDLTPYLEVKTVDYSKLSTEQVLKLGLQKSNPGMSEKALEFKFNKELKEKYYLDREAYPEGSAEAEYGQEQMRLDAEHKRKEFIDEQAKFKAPEPKPDAEAQAREQAAQQRQVKLATAVTNDPVIKALKEGKIIKFGEGEESFQYPIVDAQAIEDAVLGSLINTDREDLAGVNVEDYVQALVFAQDPKAFLKSYNTHRDSLRDKKLQAELTNAAPPPAEAGQQEEKSSIQAYS